MCNNSVNQTFIYFTILAMMIYTANTVRIKELRVPDVVRVGTAVVLDCDYTLEDSADHSGLVVKWYLNDESRPVYQWIPGEKGPQGLGVLRDRLNLEYRASEDVRTVHRALHIPAPALNMSGAYTCVVSTFSDEDRQTKNMLVFVPEKSLRLKLAKTTDGLQSVVCSAESVYPQPEISVCMAQAFSIICSNVSGELEGRQVLSRERDGLFDISVIAVLPLEVLNMPAEFTCELRVPRANNYTVRKEFVYYPGNSSVTHSSVLWIVATISIYVLLRY